MALKSGSSSFACVASFHSVPSGSKRSCQLNFSQVPDDNPRYNVYQLRYARVKTCQYTYRVAHLKKKITLFTISEDRSLSTEGQIYSAEEQNLDTFNEDISIMNSSSSNHDESSGKPGIISFYNRPYKKVDKILASAVNRDENNLLWFIGPAVLVASFIVPSLYLRKLISTVFEDSLLTDFLILFFTEALFYCGVAVYLVLIDHLRRPLESSLSAANSSRSLAPQLGDRNSSVTVLVLSLIIPMATMGLVWPWTGPAASATLAPYLVGIVVQFAFEQHARYKKSPSWPTIPIIFQIYRLHQLNRAAQLVTALSFTVRGAEMTSHNVAINNSLGALLNVLQVLGVICIWSLSSFIMRFFPSRLHGRTVK